MQKKVVFFALPPVVATLIVAASVALAPQIAFCAASDFVPLHRLPDGSFSQIGMSIHDQRASVWLHEQAIVRIAKVYGQPIAHPKIIFLSDADHFWPFTFESFGTTAFAGTRACVVVGPDRRNVDV